jgi:AcrR family transcriptional regulator
VASNKASESLYSDKASALHEKTKSTFIAAGISAIAEHGVDGISVSAVTQLAGSTRPTFYSQFGDIDGLLADIWLSHGTWFLENLADREFRFEVADAQTQQNLTALLEIFTVSNRKLEVQEVVQPSVQKWWLAKTGDDVYAKLKLAWFVGMRLGAWLTYPIEPKALLAGFAEPVIFALGKKQRSTVLPLKQLKLPNLADPKFSSASVENVLIESAITVISKVGVKSSSMTRISRNAQLTTGSTYPRFKNVEALVLASFERAITQVTQENFSKIAPVGFTPDDFGNITTAGLQSSRKIWRNFRVETHLAARTDEKLGTAIRDALSKTNKQVAQGLGLLPVSNAQREAVAFLVHVIGIGLALLLNSGVPVDQLDHRIITRDLILQLSEK